MTKIQSVLVATDFSSDSLYAVKRATMLSTELSAEKVVVLHILETSLMDNLKSFLGKSIKIEKDIINESYEALSKLIEENRKKSDCPLKAQVLTGNTLDSISKTAADYDLLVIGAHGQHPVRTLALGTTAQRLVSKIQKPILIVKNKPERPYQNILIAVDFSSNSEKAIKYGCTIAPGALIYVVHVFEPIFEKKLAYAGIPDETIEKYRIETQIRTETELKEFIRKSKADNCKPVSIVEHGHAPGKLPEIADKLEPDLIIAGKHGRSQIEELLLGSVTLHLLSQSQCDVLVVQ